MAKLQLQFLDREVRVELTRGAIIGTLEAVGDDGSLLIRQGPTPVWIPLHQVRWVTPTDGMIAPSDD
jgi:hypothetical protein